jgi:hypothetical protein
MRYLNLKAQSASQSSSLGLMKKFGEMEMHQMRLATRPTDVSETNFRKDGSADERFQLTVNLRRTDLFGGSHTSFQNECL